MRFTIIGNYGVGNFGDEAILEGLRTVIRRKYPTAEIEVMGKGNLMPFGVRSFARALLFWEAWIRPLRLLRRADTVIIGGGGLFTDEESSFSTIFWSLHGIFAHYILKKKVVCLGISIGKMHSISSFFAKSLFRICRGIVVRDRSSVNMLNKWGISGEMVPDFALGMDFAIAPERQLQSNEKYIVINVRPLELLDEKLIKIIVQFVNRVISDLGFKIIFLPLSIGPNSDAQILNKILDQCVGSFESRSVLVPTSVRQIVNLIWHAECIVSTRLHGGILSLLTPTPCIPISYMTKVRNFWAGYSNDHTILSVNQLTSDILMKTFVEALKSPRPSNIQVEIRASKFLSTITAATHKMI